MLGGDGDEVLRIEVELFGTHRPTRFVLNSAVSRRRRAAPCLAWDSALVVSFLRALRLLLGGVNLPPGGLDGILAGGEGECGIRWLRRRVKFLLFLPLETQV